MIADLGSDVTMMFHPNMPLHHLAPVRTLTDLLTCCNQQLDSGGAVTDDMINLIRVNLFAAEFQQGSQIIKPIQVHIEHFNLVVARGDTRLMAAELVASLNHAPVLCLVPRSWQAMFARWIEIQHWDQLTDQLAFPRGCVRASFDRINDTIEFSFLEFELSQTAHHLHDEQQRRRMMTNYLAQQSSDFRFSTHWAQQPIDWQQFDY